MPYCQIARRRRLELRLMAYWPRTMCCCASMGDTAVIAYAKKHGIEFETIIASKGEHVHEKVLHLQNVNAAVSRFKKWLARFNGVASKYLPNYLAWRRRLETGEIPFAPMPC